jgi:shikimate dehydrogenase
MDLASFGHLADEAGRQTKGDGMTERARDEMAAGQPGFRAAGVIGWPVAHSRSPMLHSYWLRQYGIAGTYLLFPVQPGRMAAALRGLPALGLAGCNVTVPHKAEAAALVDRIDDAARRVGAVNLVVVEADGSLSGSNTDGFGFLANLREACPAWRADAGPAVVLGAGGGARSAVASLLDSGAPEVRQVNRTRARAEQIATEIGGNIVALGWDSCEAALRDAALLVNTTTLGMVGQPALDLALDRLPVAAVVYDIVYNPLWTPLLLAAQARGNAVVGGLGMLLHQARPSFAAWFGVLPDITPELRQAVESTIG